MYRLNKNKTDWFRNQGPRFYSSDFDLKIIFYYYYFYHYYYYYYYYFHYEFGPYTFIRGSFKKRGPGNQVVY